MKAHIYTDEEIKKLKSNLFVKNVKYKREISYEPVFKLWAIMMRLYRPELSAKEIFEYANFDTSILNSKLPQKRIREWLDNYKKYGVNYFFPVDKPYENIITEVKSNEEQDEFKGDLLYYVLDRLEEWKEKNEKS